MTGAKQIWFAEDRIFLEMKSGEVFSQPMRFFVRLSRATDEQRKKWTQSYSGLHWREIDEDISFESFTWGDDDPDRRIYRG